MRHTTAGGATSAVLPLLLLAVASGIILKAEKPLLDLNDRLIQLVLSGSDNEVVCPAALYQIFAAAHEVADDRTRRVIETALGTNMPSLISRQLDAMAEQEDALSLFFTAYSSPKVLSECGVRQLSSLDKRRRCGRLTRLLTERGVQLDLSRPAAVERINGDVAAATDGRIDGLFSHLAADTRLVLAAALVFSARWLPELGATPTGLLFHRSAGPQRVPAVQAAAPMRFLNASDDGVLAAALPYSDGRLQLEMFFFAAADADRDVTALLRRSHYERLAATSPFATNVVLTFPKFRLASRKHDYADVARALGLGALLEGGLGPDGADRVDQLAQRAVIDVDEAGTTAAGAAGASIIPRVGSDETTPRVLLALERPFVCSVVHVGSITPLFTAHVVDPVSGGAEPAAGL